MKIYATLTMTATVFLAACTSISPRSGEPALGSLSAPLAYEFLSNRPRPGESFQESVSNKDWAIEVTTRNVQLLRDINNLNVHIIGFTDNVEAEEPGCTELARRRAVLTHAWLIQHGVEPSRISTTRWYCNEMPLDMSGTPEARQLNRRVEVNWE